MGRMKNNFPYDIYTILQQTIYGKYLGKRKLKKVIQEKSLSKDIIWLLLTLHKFIQTINNYLTNNVSDKNTFISALYALEYIQNLINCIVYEYFLDINQYKVITLIQDALTEYRLSHVMTTWEDIYDFVQWIEDTKPSLQQNLFMIKLLPEVKRIYTTVDKNKNNF